MTQEEVNFQKIIKQAKIGLQERIDKIGNRYQADRKDLYGKRYLKKL